MNGQRIITINKIALLLQVYTTNVLKASYNFLTRLETGKSNLHPATGSRFFKKKTLK